MRRMFLQVFSAAAVGVGPLSVTVQYFLMRGQYWRSQLLYCSNWKAYTTTKAAQESECAEIRTKRDEEIEENVTKKQKKICVKFTKLKKTNKPNLIRICSCGKSADK